MSGYEVPQPILNSPFDPPAEHWHIVEGEPPTRVQGRRRAIYFYRDPAARDAQGQTAGVPVELELVNLIRERLDKWRAYLDVDVWTSKEVREVHKSHLNYVVADTRLWEQQAAYYLDSNDSVHAFVKNQGLNFTIPYLHNGQAQAHAERQGPPNS